VFLSHPSLLLEERIANSFFLFKNFCERPLSRSLNGTIGDKIVTYDFARLMEGAKEVKCSQFGDALIGHM
jgi:isocitrate dehydrogenase